MIWRYLTQWMKVSPLIDGERLKTLGYSPGPEFRVILDAALAAQLDGLIQTPAEATTFVLTHYPT
jgi:tRNA nucleotidyltransferase (CCA-adding enzyme)